jgi:hypothetical protein
MVFSDTFVNNASHALEEMRNESKHPVCPPLVLITATYLWYIEQMQWLINAVELQAQTLKMDLSDSAAVVGIYYTSLSRL